MSQHQVVIYISDNCTYSEALVSFLESCNIAYELKNISKSDTARKELRQHNLYGTPVTFIDGETFLGVPKKRLKQKLGIGTSYF